MEVAAITHEGCFITVQGKMRIPSPTLKINMLDRNELYEIELNSNDLVISVAHYTPPIVDNRIADITMVCERANTKGLGFVSANEILSICKNEN